MTIAFCVDKRGGMLFNSRRPARDKKQVEDIMALRKGRPFYVTGYSFELFRDEDDITVDDCLLDNAPSDAICFVENTDFIEKLDIIDEIIIYKWNLCYPFDVVFNLDLKEKGFKKISKTDFAGYLHTKITKELYRKIN